MKLIQLSRSDRLLLGILVPLSLIGAIVTYSLMPPAKSGSIVRQPSTIHNNGSGTKVAYLALERLGYQVRQIRRPIDGKSLDELAALVILEPIIGIEKDERKAIGDWVESGHTLVLAPGVRLGFGPATGNWFFDNWFLISHPAGEVDEPQRKATAQIGSELNANDPLCAGIERTVTRVEFRFPHSAALKGPLASSRVDTIWSDSYGVVAMRVHYGTGRIIALADTFWLSNLGLLEADNGELFGNLAREITGDRPGSVIGFDEYHHGFALSDDPWVALAKLMIAEHWGWGVFQAALASLLALLAAGVRFGRPLDLTPVQRRQHGEFAEAAGRTLHDAHAADLAYRTLHDHYRARIAKLVRVPPDSDPARLNDAVRTRCGDDVAGLLGEAQARAESGGASRLDVLDMATRFQRVLEVLQHAT